MKFFWGYLAFFLGLAMSSGCWAQSHVDGGFDVVLSAATGQVEIEDLDGHETVNSVALGLDFSRVPMELELRYSLVDWNPTVLIGSVGTADADGEIENISLAAKLDLSWNCRNACVYLVAGYNSGKLSADVDSEVTSIVGVEIEADYPHWGAGARYDFDSGARLNLEYLSYRIGEQDGFDFGTATAIQAGIGYRF